MSEEIEMVEEEEPYREPETPEQESALRKNGEMLEVGELCGILHQLRKDIKYRERINNILIRIRQTPALSLYQEAHPFWEKRHPKFEADLTQLRKQLNHKDLNAHPNLFWPALKDLYTDTTPTNENKLFPGGLTKDEIDHSIDNSSCQDQAHIQTVFRAEANTRGLTPVKGPETYTPRVRNRDELEFLVELAQDLNIESVRAVVPEHLAPQDVSSKIIDHEFIEKSKTPEKLGCTPSLFLGGIPGDAQTRIQKYAGKKNYDARKSTILSAVPRASVGLFGLATMFVAPFNPVAWAGLYFTGTEAIRAVKSGFYKEPTGTPVASLVHKYVSPWVSNKQEDYQNNNEHLLEIQTST